MRFLSPVVEQLRSNGHGIIAATRDVERAAKVCYKSTTLAEDPVQWAKRQLMNKGHMRPFEFGRVFYTIPKDNKLAMFAIWVFKRPWSVVTEDLNNFYISTNLRVVYENKEFSDMIFEFMVTPDYRYHEASFTVKWGISRVTADSFRTHTVISSLMQSTRYNNYSSGKFGHSISFICPSWFNDCRSWLRRAAYTTSLWLSEKAYMLLMSFGMASEQARGVLPLDVATEFIQCGYVCDWNQFFSERAHDSTGKAHPDARYIASEAEKLFDNYKSCLPVKLAKPFSPLLPIAQN